MFAKLISLAVLGLLMAGATGCASILDTTVSASSRGLDRFETQPRYTGSQAYPGVACQSYSSPKTGKTVINACSSNR